MNLSSRWTAVLEEAGFNAAHWSTLGAANSPDVEIMAYAKQNSCVILTHDLDFSAILAASQNEKPSVIQIRAGDVNPDAISKQVIAALRQMSAELEQGALLTVDLKRTRLRILPFRTEE